MLELDRNYTHSNVWQDNNETSQIYSLGKGQQRLVEFFPLEYFSHSTTHKVDPVVLHKIILTLFPGSFCLKGNVKEKGFLKYEEKIKFNKSEFIPSVKKVKFVKQFYSRDICQLFCFYIYGNSDYCCKILVGTI